MHLFNMLFDMLRARQPASQLRWLFGWLDGWLVANVVPTILRFDVVIVSRSCRSHRSGVQPFGANIDNGNVSASAGIVGVSL